MNIKEIIKRLDEIKRGTWTNEHFESDWNRFYFGICELEKDIEKSSGSLRPVIESQASIQEFYVARDDFNDLYIFKQKPTRDKSVRGMIWSSYSDCMKINNEQFQDLKYEDEPIEVKLVEVKD